VEDLTGYAMHDYRPPPLALFFDEHTEAAPGVEIKFADAYKLYAAWFKEFISPEGYAGSHKRFGLEIKKRGYKVARKCGVTYYFGLKINMPQRAKRNVVYLDDYRKKKGLK
jgi:hypothetical protein